MTSLFPHTPYAEDQVYAHSILYLHVMRASSMSFAFLSTLQIPITLFRNRRAPIDRATLLVRTLRTSGRAFALGAAAGAAMTWGRMRGREEIEWQDRSWRIIENEGEVKTDWATIGAAGVGAAASLVAVRRGALPISTGSAVLGGVGLGASMGVPFMIATYAMGRKPA